MYNPSPDYPPPKKQTALISLSFPSQRRASVPLFIFFHQLSPPSLSSLRSLPLCSLQSLCSSPLSWLPLPWLPLPLLSATSPYLPRLHPSHEIEASAQLWVRLYGFFIFMNKHSGTQKNRWILTGTEDAVYSVDFEFCSRYFL